MEPSVGVNLRVTGHCSKGGRKYMEDAFSVGYLRTENEQDLEYAYFGIFDGHGGHEAAVFAKEHLKDFIVSQKNFWSDDDKTVMKAIKDGFLNAHLAMWKELGNWPKRAMGLPSTSGTTASVAFIRRRKIFIGHVGDSAIVLGYRTPGKGALQARALTHDHKPESPTEKRRIERCGGQVISKSGVPRVVWNRPIPGHSGPVRRSTHIDQIPFLAVARSLGDFWSYDYSRGEFIISPEPDVLVMPLDITYHRCLILGTDGLWNMLSSKEAVEIVEQVEKENERVYLEDRPYTKHYLNHSHVLVVRALERWVTRSQRADNTSVVTVLFDPPGPSWSKVLERERMLKRLRPRIEVEVDMTKRKRRDTDAEDEAPTSKQREQRVLDAAHRYVSPCCDSANDPPETSEQSHAKRKAEKKAKKELRKAEEKRKDTAKPTSSTELALQYVRLWKTCRQQWKFMKVRQVWLLRHLYHTEKIGEHDFDTVVDYLNSMQGRARKDTIDRAKKIIQQFDDNADLSPADRATYSRARLIVQSLEE